METLEDCDCFTKPVYTLKGNAYNRDIEIIACALIP